MHVRACTNELIRFIHIAVEITPDERRLTVNLTSAGFKFFANQEDLLVICIASESEYALRDTRIYTRI